MPKDLFGLIGYPLTHSFSKKYFKEKFEKEGISDAEYQLFEIESIQSVENVFAQKNLKGFNITIPYKEEIKPYLTNLDPSARKVGAVNVVKLNPDGTSTGYNSDYFGFKSSLEKWADVNELTDAIILGSGGASKAIQAVLDDLNIAFRIVSRSKTKGDITYEELNNESYDDFQLIINSTPLGTFPNIDQKPPIQYQKITSNHNLYDLVYNPSETVFMTEGKKMGAKVKNGLEMLVLQAEKSWEIWNS